MSLTSELKSTNAPLRRFLSEQVPDVSAIRKEARSRVTGRPTLKPDGRVSWTTIGTAIDYRIRFYFPGMTERTRTWDSLRPGTPFMVPSDTRTKPLAAEHATSEAPTLQLLWQAQILATDFFVSLRDLARDIQPAQRRLSESQEANLNRYCYVLALLDEISRAGWTIGSPLNDAIGGGKLEDVLALCTPEAVDDLSHLSWAFYDQASHLLSGDAELNPTFAGSSDIGGADADLLVDGCLIEIKSTIDMQKGWKPWWSWEPLGYTLLDYDDECRIRSLGFYLTRQASLITWPLAEYVSKLGMSPASVANLRNGLRALLRTQGSR